MNIFTRAWRWVTRKTSESHDGYPVNPYPAYYRPGDAERRDFFDLILDVDRWERRRGGTIRERLTDERIVVVARSLEKYNPFAKSILTGLRSYVLGRAGMQVTCVSRCHTDDDEPEVAKAQAFLDCVRNTNKWLFREREAYVRAHRDGEVFFRIGVDADGNITIRFIEPEFVRGDGSIEFDQGVRVDPDDNEVPLEYAVEYTPGAFDYVDASEVYHIKLNVDGIMRRGVSDFAATAKVVDQALVAVRNMISSEAYRQGNAWVTQHEAGTERTSVDNMGGGIVPRFDTCFDASGEVQLSHVSEGVSVLHISKGQVLAGTPGGEAINGCIAAINQAVQVAVAPYRMPLSVVTGDTSRNNAIDMGSDHPFSTYVQDEQSLFGEHWRCLFWKCIEWGVTEGLLPASVLQKVEVVVTPQQPAMRDPKAATERLRALELDNIISKKKRTEMEGFEFDEQQEQIKKERAAGVESPPPAVAPPEGSRVNVSSPPPKPAQPQPSMNGQSRNGVGSYDR